MSIFSRIRLAPTTPQAPIIAIPCAYDLCDGFGLIEVENKAWKPGIRLMACPCSKKDPV